MSLAAIHHDLLTHNLPPVMPADCPDTWGLGMPIMRSFPRLAVEPDEVPVVEARFDEEPERWDGMA